MPKEQNLSDVSIALPTSIQVINHCQSWLKPRYLLCSTCGQLMHLTYLSFLSHHHISLESGCSTMCTVTKDFVVTAWPFTFLLHPVSCGVVLVFQQQVLLLLLLTQTVTHSCICLHLVGLITFVCLTLMSSFCFQMAFSIRRLWCWISFLSWMNLNSAATMSLSLLLTDPVCIIRLCCLLTHACLHCNSI